MDTLSSLILSAAEFSNLLSSLALISFTGAIIIFFVKVSITILAQRDEVISSAAAQQISRQSVSVPQLNMTRVHIPFTFRLSEAGNKSTEEVGFVLTSQTKYSVQAFWGVSIRDLHMFLWKPWSEIKELAFSHNSSILPSQYYHQIAVDLRNQESQSEKLIKLTSPKPPMTLGAPPRLAYPLVVFLLRHDDDESCQAANPDDTVLLINVIHLKDPVCPLPTSILAQYLKQTSGQLSCLKQLYLATGDSIASDSSDTSSSSAVTTACGNSSSLSFAEPVACAGSGGPLLCSDGPQTEQLCVVCHYFPLSRALLPCRHVCICAVCFSKLNRCPMCRAPITSYFCIRSEEYVPPGIFEQRLPRTKNTTHWIDAFNDRLTDFLGFR